MGLLKQRRPISSHPAFPENQSRILPGDEQIHESVLIAEGKLFNGPNDLSTKTIYELVQRGIRITNDGPLFGEQELPDVYTWTSYGQLAANAEKIGAALVYLGIAPGEASRVGIAGVNCVEYLTATLGLVDYSIVNVPLYHNYKFEALIDIINTTNLEIIFCDTKDRAQQFITSASDMPNLKKIIIFHPDDTLVSEGSVKLSEELEIFSLEKILQLGSKHPAPLVLPNEDSVYIICNTSGTTGKPKGVQLTHKSLLTAMGGLYYQWTTDPSCMSFDTSDVYLSYLSPAHIYEQILQCFMMYIGGRIGLFGGDVSKLLNDMQVLKPTIAPFVPRLLNKFHDAIQQRVSQAGLFKRFVFRLAIAAKKKHLDSGIVRYDTVWDRLFLNKLRLLFGGRLKLITSGGAPITEKVMKFSKIVYGCPLVEGYGQSECAAAGSLSLPYDPGYGHVGAPAAWAQIKLVDVPEMGYFAKTNRGEVCFRGAGIMKGYFNDPDLTAMTIDPAGWLHTGDIGQWLPNGTLQIIDRKNNMFKLAQGDFVSPEQVENVYCQHKLVNQAFVDGKTTESFLVAIIVVNVDVLESEIAKNQNNAALFDEELNSAVNKKLVIGALDAFAGANGLTSIERVRAIHLTKEEFTVESGLLTPTLKLKRQIIRQKFEKVIEQLFLEEGKL